MTEVRDWLVVVVVVFFLWFFGLLWIAGESHHETCVVKGNAEGRSVDQCSVLPWSSPGDPVTTRASR